MKLDFLKDLVDKAGGAENIINQGMKIVSSLSSKDDKKKEAPSDKEGSGKSGGIGNIVNEGVKIVSGLLSDKGNNPKK